VTCKEVADFLDDYLAGDLSGRVRALFDTHLSRCPNCREYLALYRTTVSLGRSALDDAAHAVEHGIPEELVASILASRKQT
jgi:predicted anti-sigma-YlaC factor YlaD